MLVPESSLTRVSRPADHSDQMRSEAIQTSQEIWREVVTSWSHYNSSASSDCRSFPVQYRLIQVWRRFVSCERHFNTLLPSKITLTPVMGKTLSVHPPIFLGIRSNHWHSVCKKRRDLAWAQNSLLWISKHHRFSCKSKEQKINTSTCVRRETN